jgi:flagellin-like protein
MGMGIYHIHQSQKGGIKEKMNTIRKMKKNAKALSPVVASIILIAVTVAVSIAVAAWMGALVVGQMVTEEVKITSMTFTVGNAANGRIVLKVSNIGTTPVTISEVWVNNVAIAAGNVAYSSGAGTINANSNVNATITTAVDAGYSYSVKLVSAKGNSFTYVGSAPS